jgi:hypothetical protein
VVTKEKRERKGRVRGRKKGKKSDSQIYVRKEASPSFFARIT